jgi:micrococcal nuclease
VFEPYWYKATVTKVVDGDTVHATVEYGLDQRGDYTLRLAGIDAPELSTNEGKIAKAFVEDWLESRPHILIKTVKDHREKYGRYLAVIYDAERAYDPSLNQVLLDEHLARPYDGGAR